jgi:hypothetical protein
LTELPPNGDAPARHVFRRVRAGHAITAVHEKIEQATGSAGEIEHVSPGRNSRQRASQTADFPAITPAVAELRRIFFGDLRLIEPENGCLMTGEPEPVCSSRRVVTLIDHGRNDLRGITRLFGGGGF